MKKYIFLFIFALLAMNLSSTSLDGTANVVYQENHYVFSDGDSVRGFVKLSNGFTVPKNSTVTFNSDIPISGGIDLRTFILILQFLFRLVGIFMVEIKQSI